MAIGIPLLLGVMTNDAARPGLPGGAERPKARPGRPRFARRIATGCRSFLDRDRIIHGPRGRVKHCDAWRRPGGSSPATTRDAGAKYASTSSAGLAGLEPERGLRQADRSGGR